MHLQPEMSSILKSHCAVRATYRLLTKVVFFSLKPQHNAAEVIMWLPMITDTELDYSYGDLVTSVAQEVWSSILVSKSLLADSLWKSNDHTTGH